MIVIFTSLFPSFWYTHNNLPMYCITVPDVDMWKVLRRTEIKDDNDSLQKRHIMKWGMTT